MEAKKSDLKPGDIVGVYASDDELFWLMRIETNSGRKIRGKWFNLVEGKYELGDVGELTFNNVIRKEIALKEFFVFQLKDCRLSDAASNYLKRHVKTLL